MMISGKSYTLLKDYDAGQYKYLKFPDKTLYLKERVNLIVISPCQEANKTALTSNLGLILVTGICAAISAAGTFLKGQRAPGGQDRTYFTDFVDKYMDRILQQNCAPSQTWAEWLYDDVRCGLSHSFPIETGVIEYQVPSYVLVRPYGPEIDPTRFLKDFAQGFSKYLADVVHDGPGTGIGALFEKRFDEIFHD